MNTQGDKITVAYSTSNVVILFYLLNFELYKPCVYDEINVIIPNLKVHIILSWLIIGERTEGLCFVPMKTQTHPTTILLI